jgi:superfamily II DNA/RNA helicase
MNFTDLGLAEPLLRAVRDQGYDIPTPIQAPAGSEPRPSSGPFLNELH